MWIKLLLPFFLIAASLGAKEYGALRVKEVVRVIDGDTIKVDIHGIHPLIGDGISVRLAGIDTAELSSTDPRIKKLALEAKAFVEKALANSDNVLLLNIKRGKYFRILAEVYVDGERLADKLLEAGLAVPYKGGKKPDWATLSASF